MDTEIFYKYKDGLHPDLKTGQITLDKSIYKSYKGSYGTNFSDSVLYSLPRRLWHCSLVWEGDSDCKRFLNDLKEFWTKSEVGFAEGYEERFKVVHEFLMKQELVEIKFTCY